MRKFSKILESLDSEVVSIIKDIFIDLQDKGFVIKVDESSGYYTINLTCDEKNDWMECARELVDCDKRLSAIDLEYIDSKYINLGQFNNSIHLMSRISLRYKVKGSVPSADNVNGWKEFKSYCENVLGIDGIKSPYFELDIMNKESWTDKCPDGYEGFAINYGQDTPSQFGGESNNDFFKKQLISHYPGYEGFLRKYLEYDIDWNLIHKQGEWENREDKKTPIIYPIPFNKEGIEVVKTLMKMIS